MANDTSLMLNVRNKLQEAKQYSKGYSQQYSIPQANQQVLSNQTITPNKDNTQQIVKGLLQQEIGCAATVVDFASSIGNGILNVMDSFGDIVLGGIGSAVDFFGGDSSWFTNHIQYDWQTKALQEKIGIDILSNNSEAKSALILMQSISMLATQDALSDYSYFNKLDDNAQETIRGMGEFVGEMAPSLTLAYFTGGQSLGVQAGIMGSYSYMNTAGNSLESSLKQGNDLQRAYAYASGEGLVSGALSAGSMYAGSAFTKSGGTLAARLGDTASKNITNETAKVVVDKGVKILTNAGVSAAKATVQKALDPVVEQITINDNAIQEKWGSSEYWEEVKNSALQAAAISAVIDTGREAIDFANYGKDGYMLKYHSEKLATEQNKLDKLYKQAAKGEIDRETFERKSQEIANNLIKYGKATEKYIDLLSNKDEFITKSGTKIASNQKAKANPSIKDFQKNNSADLAEKTTEITRYSKQQLTKLAKYYEIVYKHANFGGSGSETQAENIHDTYNAKENILQLTFGNESIDLPAKQENSNIVITPKNQYQVAASVIALGNENTSKNTYALIPLNKNYFSSNKNIAKINDLSVIEKGFSVSNGIISKVEKQANMPILTMSNIIKDISNNPLNIIQKNNGEISIFTNSENANGSLQVFESKLTANNGKWELSSIKESDLTTQEAKNVMPVVKAENSEKPQVFEDTPLRVKPTNESSELILARRNNQKGTYIKPKATIDIVHNFENGLLDTIKNTMITNGKTYGDIKVIKPTGSRDLARYTFQQLNEIEPNKKVNAINKLIDNLVNSRIEYKENGELKSFALNQLLDSDDFQEFKLETGKYVNDIIKLNQQNTVVQKQKNYYVKKLNEIEADYKEKITNIVSKYRGVIKSIKNKQRYTYKAGKIIDKLKENYDKDYGFTKERLSQNADKLVVNTFIRDVNKSNSGITYNANFLTKIDEFMSNYTPENWVSDSYSSPLFIYDENFASMVDNFRETLSKDGGRMNESELKQYSAILNYVKKTIDVVSNQNAYAQSIGNSIGIEYKDKVMNPLLKSVKGVLYKTIPNKGNMDLFYGGTAEYKPLCSDLIQANSTAKHFNYLGQEMFDKEVLKNTKIIRKTGLFNLAEKKYDIESFDGKKVKVTGGELEFIYRRLKYESDAVNKSGLKYYDKKNHKLITLVNKDNANSYFKNNVEKILTPKEMKAMEYLQDFHNTTFRDNFVIPYANDNNYTDFELLENQATLVREKDFDLQTGIKKMFQSRPKTVITRKKGATDPIVICDDFELEKRMIKQYSMGLSRKDANGNVVPGGLSLFAAHDQARAVLRSRTNVREDNNNRFKTVATTIKEYDYKLYEYTSKYVDRYVEINEINKSPIEKLTDNYVLSVLAVNPSVTIKQVFSGLISPVPFTKVIGSLFKKLDANQLRLYNEIKNESGYFQARSGELLSGSTVSGDFKLQELANKGMALPTATDKFTIDKMGLRAYVAILPKTLKYDLSDPKQYAIAKEKIMYQYEVNFNATQVGSNPESKSNISYGTELERVLFDKMRGPARGYMNSLFGHIGRAIRNQDVDRNKLIAENQKLKVEVDKLHKESIKLGLEYNNTIRKIDGLKEQKRNATTQDEYDYLSEEIKKLENQKKQQDNDYHEARVDEDTATGRMYDNEEKIKDNETYELSGKKLSIPIFAVATGVMASLLTLIDEIAERLKGKKEWNEFDAESYIKDTMLTAFTSNLPVVNEIVNVISGYDAEIPSVTLINDIADLVNRWSEVDTNDSRKVKALSNSTLITASQVLGLPLKTFEKYSLGIIKSVDLDTYLTINGDMYSTSYTKENERLSNYVKSNKLDKASVEINYIYDNYKTGKLDDTTSNELVRLLANNQNVMANNIPSYYTDDNGLTITLESSQKELFKTTYSKSNSMVAKLIKSSSYRTIDDELKASAIKSVYNAYYDAAKSKVYDNYESTTNFGFMVANSKVDISKYAAIYQEAKSLEATKNKTKREVIQAYMNSNKQLTKDEKLLVMHLLGYKLSDDNYKRVKVFLMSKGMSLNKANEFLS